MISTQTAPPPIKNPSRLEAVTRTFGLARPRRGSCHGPASAEITGLAKIALVGSPNVGKSVTFGRLTGVYVTVSNYPGTTVDVTRGRGRLGEHDYEIVDTPGMYSLLPISEEERVARSILFDERPAVVVHVVDAKNLDRMLPLTLQLIEAGLPVVLNLNMMDEAERLGMRIDLGKLEKELGIPVVTTVSTSGRGLAELKERIHEHASQQQGAAALCACH